MQASGAMEEQRQTYRQRTYKGARVVFRGRAAIRCIIRNLSEAGACLLVDNPFGVPDKIHLVFDGPEADRTCWVVWRNRDRIGVSFE
jgi:hypothetical protein